ncbi:MAG: HPr family phosphocarrier protein [Cellulomonas sp.]|nr:HPr family phosphocarrier protein [Cellulomonas sp.]
MPERRVVVAIEEGLHARPAALFVKLAAAQPVAVTIRKPDGSPVPTRSILSVMTLGARRGDEVVLETDDASGCPSLDALSAYLTTAG